MEKIIKMSVASLFLATMFVGFTSCSDDNEEPEKDKNTQEIVNPSNVFTGEMPKSIAGSTISRNSENLVTEILTEDGKLITFDYVTLSRASEQINKVKMTILDDDLKSEYDMTIGDNGFVCESGVKITSDSGNKKDEEEGIWSFTYDSEGHLINAKHIYRDIYGDGQYYVTLKWKDNNIIRTFKDDDMWDNYTYQYTSTDYPTPIENKGAIFMFEDIYPIEIYDFEWVYYAGMLGKGPKNLAVSSCEDYDNKEEEYVEFFIWTLNQDGYPIKFDNKNEPDSWSLVKFAW